jgi:hypothetical protein
MQVGSAFSTVHFFVYGPDEMKMETMDQPFDRRQVVLMTDCFDCKIVAPETGGLLTNIFAS